MLLQRNTLCLVAQPLQESDNLLQNQGFFWGGCRGMLPSDADPAQLPLGHLCSCKTVASQDEGKTLQQQQLPCARHCPDPTPAPLPPSALSPLYLPHCFPIEAHREAQPSLSRGRSLFRDSERLLGCIHSQGHGPHLPERIRSTPSPLIPFTSLLSLRALFIS